MTKRKRGRPSFNVTPKLRQQVSVAAGAGMAHDEIAMGLGISRNTLEKHFEQELTVGAHARRLEVVVALHRAAKKGNVAAARQYTAIAPRGTAPPPTVAPPKSVSKPEGKKAQADADARVAQVGTEWETLLKPAPSSVQ